MRVMFRISVALTSTLAILVALLFANAVPAWAINCDADVAEYQIEPWDGSHQGIGSAGTLHQWNRTLADACQSSGKAQTWSTVQADNYSLPERQVEAGIREYWACVTSCSHQWKFFWEAQVGNTVSVGEPILVVSCCNDYRFKVQQTNGKWYFWYHSGDTGTFINFGPSNGYDDGFTNGHPLGETGVTNNSTGARDTHYHDSYQGSAGNWKAWGYWSLSRTPNITGWCATEDNPPDTTAYSVKRC